MPDARTVWLFRERMASTGKDREFWEVLNSQLREIGIHVREGHPDDAIFVELGGLKPEGSAGKVVEVSKDTAHLRDSTMLEADPGAPTAEDVMRRKQKEAEAKKEKAADEGTASLSSDELSRTKERGDEANTRRSRDGTWTVKRGKSYFGYKLHTKVYAKTGMIEDYEVTTASVHDSQVDLSKPGELIIGDKAYSGAATRGYALSMIRAYRNNPLTEEDRELNRFLSGIRAGVEHPYAAMRRVFHFTRMFVTTISRVRVKAMLMCACFNLMRAAHLTRLAA